MTQEEKARAYDEALERARKMLNMILDNELLGFPDQIREIFPQLRESNDERIREELIEYHKRQFENNRDQEVGLFHKDALAYLERQKEQKPGEDEKTRKELIEFIQWSEDRGMTRHDFHQAKRPAEWIAYLEKQKENIEKEYVFRPLAGTDITIAAEQAIRKANEGDRLVLAFNGAYIPVRKGCNANKIVDIYDAFIEKQKDASKAIEAVDRIDKYIDEHLANAHDMKDSNPDKKYYRGWDDALGEMAKILQDVYSEEKQKDLTTENIYKHSRERMSFYNEHPKEQKPAEPSGKPSRQEYLYHLLANGVITFSDYEFLLRNKGRKPADLSEMMVHKEPYIAPVPTPIVADEQKPINHNFTTFHRDVVYCAMCNKNLDEGLRCNLEIVYKIIKDIVDRTPVIREQKQEWSEDIIQKAVKEVGLTQHQIDWFKTNVFPPKQEWSDEDKEALDMCLDAIPKRWKTKSGILLTKWLKDNIHLQPKQEWSEEDKENINSICLYLDDYCRSHENDSYGVEECKYLKSWLKALLLNLKKHNEAVAKLCSNEWSEEDEDMLNSCISSIEEAKENRYAYKETDGDTSYDHEIDWLKSLRPSWKPSEEQMETLKRASTNEYLSAKQFDILVSLYEQLKKL